MFIKSYLRLLIETIYKPQKVYTELAEQPFKFHLLYYAIFNFFFGLIIALAISSDGVDVFKDMSVDGSPFDMALSFLFGMPIFLLVVSMYFDFVQKQLFREDKKLFRFYGSLVWSYHYFITLLLLTTIPMSLLIMIQSTLSQGLLMSIMCFPFGIFIWLALVSAKVSLVNRWWKAAVVYGMGGMLIYIPTYLLTN